MIRTVFFGFSIMCAIGYAFYEFVNDRNQATGEFQNPTSMRQTTSQDRENIRRRYTNNECPICLDEIKISSITLPCQHRLHTKCYNDLMNTNIARCPLCRKQI